MPLRALHAIRPMRGRTGPQLMLCENNALYVVKFHWNRLGGRVLVSDLLGTRLGRWAGLPFPDCEIIDVDPSLAGPFEIPAERGRFAGRSDAEGNTLHFGSRVVGGVANNAVDHLPASYLAKLSNGDAFLGVLALDKLCSNIDRRQTVFQRDLASSTYSPFFIDQSDCFGGPDWQFNDTFGQGLFHSRSVYHDVTGLHSFEPYLSRITQGLTHDIVWGFCKDIPEIWHDHHKDSIEELVYTLLKRRLDIVDQMCSLRDETSLGLFPQWKRHAYSHPSVTCTSIVGDTLGVI